MISKDLAGPVGLFVKFSVLQEYGVDRVFLLENGNTDSSQKNIVFLVHAEKPAQVQSTAGMIILCDMFVPIFLGSCLFRFLYVYSLLFDFVTVAWENVAGAIT